MQKSIKNILQGTNIEHLNEMQEQCLSSYVNAEQLILYAPTGSGKTLGFLLPVLSSLKASATEVLIIAPTRELVLQIVSVIKSLNLEVSVAACYGGHSVKTEENNLSADPTVIVGTPGRLEDHLRRGNLNFLKTRFLVVDEFDKCLEFGFSKELSKIFKSFRSIEKEIYCSATPIEEFPDFVPNKIKSEVNFLDSIDQPDLTYFNLNEDLPILDKLNAVLNHSKGETSIIFCNFREEVDELTSLLLQRDYSAVGYHGGMEQEERQRALIKFNNESCNVLICTDIGARGLDIDAVKHILHFQIPEKKDAWIHRNGRTARMDKSGSVYFFEELPDDYLEEKASVLKVNSVREKYQKPQFTTVYFSGGKKDKINKIDLLGFICKKGELDGKLIGTIDVLDRASYVAIKKKNIHDLLRNLRAHKVKGKKLRIAISK